MSEFDEVVHLITKSDPVIIEVGANDGHHTKLFLDRFPGATIYAFEPNPRALRKHREAVADPRVMLIPAAAGRTGGRASFYQSSGSPPEAVGDEWAEGWDQSGSILEPKRHLDCYPWVKFEQVITVDVVSLDDWADQEGVHTVDLIWADVQGA